MPKSRHRSLLRVVGSRPGLPALAAALAILATLVFAATAEAASARVSADGDCLNMRQSPSLTGALITCVGDGEVVTLIPGTVTADGMEWQQVRTVNAIGWVAARYLVAVPDGQTAAPSAPAPAPAAAPAAPQPAPAAPVAFEAPPPGGLTFGLAGTTSPHAVAEAQGFPVVGVSAIEPLTQRYLTYIPGAPAIVNTLDETTLRADMVVMVRRAGELAPSDTRPLIQLGHVPGTVGTPHVFATPARDGLTLGVAGTNDVAALIAAQPFAVDVVMSLDVSSQSWLTYIPGAPDWVNTLNRGTLTPSTVVFIRRSATAPDPVRPAPAEVVKPARALVVPVTYYYCTQTAGGGAGDGGGFCGAMRNGQVVHRGAASCSGANFGQRFRVVGDPTAQVYTCKDTGGGVHNEHRDIWFATSDEAFSWWKTVAPSGYATIEVLE
ncbi:MAG: hypothetical protein AB7G21_09840 [Dehalococcoidia bacterium]